MCPNPGMMLNRTAIASLALPSAVCVAPRVQSHWSQRSASFGRRCPQNGQAILSPAAGSGRAGGASVYAMFVTIVWKNWTARRAVATEKERLPAAAGLWAVSFETPKTDGIRQVNLTANKHESTRRKNCAIRD